jgi:GT2 family glycosyltransferase
VARTWYGKLNAERQGDLAWVPACNTWVSRDTFERVGRFDESIETNEDCEFCERVRAAGLRVIGRPEIAVVHLGTPDGLWEFYRKISWHATDGLRVFLRDPSALMNARPVLFGLYTLVCLAGIVTGVVLYAWQKRLALAVVSLTALILPSLLLSVRLVLRRKNLADLFPLTLLNLVYGLARGRSLLVAENWER